MIDKGTRPFARRLAYGNFWHGYKLRDGSYRSRAGVAMSGFPTASVLAISGPDAHLVDLGMPAVSTPTDEATIGMERWNKAVLHGSTKRYAIACNLTGRQFGYDGWPYKCPDGTVYFMRAECDFGSPNLLQIKSRLLDAYFTRPTAAGTIIGSLAVPGLVGVDTVNFSPNGSKAAAHSYLNTTDTTINWIVEIDVSGGSLSSQPSVSLSLTFTTANATAYLDGASPQVDVWAPTYTSVVTYEPIDATNRVRVNTYTPHAGYGPAQRDLWSGYIADVVAMVVYDASGGRHVLRSGSGVKNTQGQYTGFATVQVGITRQQEWLTSEGWGNNGALVVSQSLIYTLDQDISFRTSRRISRGSSVVYELYENTAVSRRWTVEVSLTEIPDAWNNVTTAGPTNTGNAWNGADSCLSNGTSVVRFKRPASNTVFLTLGTTSLSILGWAGAASAGGYGYPTALAIPDGIFPSLHPETGAFNASIINYF